MNMYTCVYIYRIHPIYKFKRDSSKLGLPPSLNASRGLCAELGGDARQRLHHGVAEVGAAEHRHLLDALTRVGRLLCHLQRLKPNTEGGEV